MGSITTSHPFAAFPAHAGMNRRLATSITSGICVPRTRGDEPAGERRLFSIANAFPAHAGMNRGCAQLMRGIPGVPRTRGDEPQNALIKLKDGTRSPHTRG